MDALLTDLFRLRAVRRGAALAGLAAILFAQAALALAACAPDRDIKAHGIVLAASPDAAPCHEAETQAANPLCQAHCQASEPMLDKHTVQPLPVPVALASTLTGRPPWPAPVFVPARQIPAASPPARILFQSLLI